MTFSTVYSYLNLSSTNLYRLSLCSVFLLLLIGCSSTHSRLTSDVQKVIWNDTDAQLVAEKMINELIADDWHETSVCNCTIKEETSIAVGVVRDYSRERLDMHKFSGNLERKLQLSNNSNLYVLAKNDHQSRNEWLKETHADFILHGSINRISDELNGANARFYQVDLVLIERATNNKTWQGQTKIRKSSNQKSMKRNNMKKNRLVAKSYLPL